MLECAELAKLSLDQTIPAAAFAYSEQYSWITILLILYETIDMYQYFSLCFRDTAFEFFLNLTIHPI